MSGKAKYIGDKTNYKGEKIGPIPILRKSEYGTGKKDRFGRPEPDWSLIIDGDCQGFDVHHVEPNGKHRMEVVLPRHTILIRYGTDAGSFTAPKDSAYEEISLPYVKESVFYHEYEVIAESITVTEIRGKHDEELCIVERGVAAPGFDYPGGSVQYLHPYNMVESINLELISEIELW